MCRATNRANNATFNRQCKRLFGLGSRVERYILQDENRLIIHAQFTIADRALEAVAEVQVISLNQPQPLQASLA